MINAPVKYLCTSFIHQSSMIVNMSAIYLQTLPWVSTVFILRRGWHSVVADLLLSHHSFSALTKLALQSLARHVQNVPHYFHVQVFWTDPAFALVILSTADSKSQPFPPANGHTQTHTGLWIGGSPVPPHGFHLSTQTSQLILNHTRMCTVSWTWCVSCMT